jgi:hypothetical protein
MTKNDTRTHTHRDKQTNKCCSNCATFRSVTRPRWMERVESNAVIGVVDKRDESSSRAVP